MPIDTTSSDHIACKSSSNNGSAIWLNAFRGNGDLWNIYRNDLNITVPDCQDLEFISWENVDPGQGVHKTWGAIARRHGDNFLVRFLDDLAFSETDTLYYQSQANRFEGWTAKWDSRSGLFVHSLIRVNNT